MSKPNVLWQANSDFQRRFLACSARIGLAGGGGGGGKTSALLAAAASQTANPRHRAAIFRKDFPSLSHIISSSFPLFLPMRATYNKSEHCWTFPSGSTIRFCHLEDQTAIYQHAGAEYSFLGFDEAQQLPGDVVDSRGQPINSAFAYLQTRLRAPKDSGLRLEIRCTATPLDRGMAWIKSYFRVTDSGEDVEFVDEVSGFRRCYFKSTYRDNPNLAPDYRKMLLDLPSAQRRALLDGDWTAREGAVFSEWDWRVHTCERFPVPAEWDVWRGGDDGYANPAAILYLAEDETHSRIFVIAELYERGMTPEVMAQRVLRIDRSIPVNLYGETVPNDCPLSGVIDSAAFAEIGLGNESGKGSRGHIMNKLGCRWSPSPKGAGSRVQGVHEIHRRLALKDDGYGGLVVFRNCKNLIRTLPQMVFSKTNPEDIDQSCEEHAVKALMYGLTRRKMQFRLMKVRGI